MNDKPLPYAKKFRELFSGLTEAYGTGKGQWIREELKPKHYSMHLRGIGPGLGVGPLRKDGTVLFAAIDLDEPDFEAAITLEELCPGRGWIERSRSGNAHIWFFFAEPIEAWVTRGILREAVAAIGKAQVEVFPKQDALRQDMLGNYINLPYFGKDRPILAINPETDYRPPMEVSHFIEMAYNSRNNVEEWCKRARWLGVPSPEERISSSERREFGTSPHLHKCAQYVIDGAISGERPIGEGSRNIVYFCLSKQLLNWEQLDTDEAWDILRAVEECSPDRIPQPELQRIFTSALRGRWTSTGCSDPVFAQFADPTCPFIKE